MTFSMKSLLVHWVHIIYVHRGRPFSDCDGTLSCGLERHWRICKPGRMGDFFDRRRIDLAEGGVGVGGGYRSRKSKLVFLEYK